MAAMARSSSPLNIAIGTGGGEFVVGSSTGRSVSEIPFDPKGASFGATGLRAGTAFMYDGLIEIGWLLVLVVLSA